MESIVPSRAPEAISQLGREPTGVARLLQHIEEEASPRSAGVFVYGAPAAPVGSVFVEGNRICWAVAARMGRRLTDILRHQSDPPLDAGLLEEVYRRCRRDSLPLGESLVASGIVSGDGLRRALRQHTAEALAVIGEARTEPPRWREHARGRYDARFSFLPAELFVSACTMPRAELAARAYRELRATLQGSGVGFAFVRDGDAALSIPIAVTSTEHVPVRMLIDIGRWATGALDIGAVVDRGRNMVVHRTEPGDGTLVWQAGCIVYVATFGDASSLACAIVSRVRSRSA